MSHSYAYNRMNVPFIRFGVAGMRGQSAPGSLQPRAWTRAGRDCLSRAAADAERCPPLAVRGATAVRVTARFGVRARAQLLVVSARGDAWGLVLGPALGTVPGR